MGMKIGQVSLHFGANDFGSLMMEESVVSAAGTTFRTTAEEIQRLITGAGFTPVRRRQDYSTIQEAPEELASVPPASFAPPALHSPLSRGTAA